MNALAKIQRPVRQFEFVELTASTFDNQLWADLCDLTDNSVVIGAGDLNFFVTYKSNDGEPVITDVQSIMRINDKYVLAGSMECNEALLAYLSESLNDAIEKQRKKDAECLEPDELDDMSAFFDKYSFRG